MIATIERRVYHFAACLLLLILLLSSGSIPAFAQLVEVPSVYGRWLTGDATVEIRDCGNGTPCGYIVKADAQDPSNPPLLDENNPEESQRTNPLIGTRILHRYSFRNGRWRRGRIYNPANGKSYSSSLELETQSRLVVKGCIGPFCQTQ